MRRGIQIERAETGKPTLILNRSDKSVAVYSRHDPERDGLRFYQKQMHDHTGAHSGLFFFIGIGLGYHIIPFTANPDVERLVILEPDKGLFQRVKDIEPVRGLLSRGGVELHVGEEINRFLDDIQGRYDYIFHGGFRIVRYPRLHQLYCDMYDPVEQRLHDGLNSLLNDASTIGRFAALWLNNFIRNIRQPGLIHPVSALFGRWSGTAVLLGAGPSLNNVLDDLKSERNGLYLVATDAALKPLMRCGIRPDLVISMDPQPTLHYHVSGLPKDEVSSIPAVLSLIGSPQVFSLFREKYLYSTRHPISQLFGTGDDELFNYTAVSSLGFRVAVEMGFDSIILAGLDFAFTGMHTYAWDSFFSDYCVHYGSRLRTPGSIEIEMIHRRGGIKLRDYGAELEALIDSTVKDGKPCVYNWRSGGSKIRGTRRIFSLPREGKAAENTSRDNAVLPLPSKEALCGDELRWLIETTLAIRNRIYRHAPSRDNALSLAHQYMQKICNI
jgi:hypothetical protein